MRNKLNVLSYFRQKCGKEAKTDARWPQKWENYPPGRPKRSQRTPQVKHLGLKGRPKGAKGSQKGAKGSQKGANGSQKGAKREPNGDQNASQSGCPEKVAPKSVPPGIPPDPFGTLFPSKIDVKIDAKIDAEKVMEIDEKVTRKWCDFSTEVHRKLIECKKWIL